MEASGESRMAILVIMTILFGNSAGLAQHQRGIRSVDFYNFTYNSDTMGKITLRNGKHEQLDKRGLWSGTSRIVSLKYLDFNGDRKKEAVVVIRSDQPSSMPVSV